MKCEAAVAILTSEGLALVSVSRQHARSSFVPQCTRCYHFKIGFARDYEWTFSKLPKVIQVPWKLPKQKDFYILINGSFNQNRLSLLALKYFGRFRAQMPTAADDTMEVPT